MSSLWTPGGEHEVPRPGQRPAAAPPPSDADDLDELDLDQLDDEERAVLEELREARARIAQVPAEQVVANHCMGLFELAAIHLSQSPPKLGEASLAIDALGAVVETLGDRLGDVTPTLRDALAQIRLAFVQVRQANAAG